jgi:tetratricopeptide (TPR) repeat protein
VIVVTHGAIAVRNLRAQIDGLEAITTSADTRTEERVELIDLLALRGSILGSVADCERAQALAQELVQDVATDATALLARARTRALFHRFSDALDDLDVAEHLGADADMVNRECAAVLQGLGRYAEAFAIREEAVRRNPGFESFAALSTLCAESGDSERALRMCGESLRRYRGISPLPLAVLDFQIGVMRMRCGDLDCARDHLSAARRYVPAYAPAQGHLAEVEAESGNIATAIALLHPLAISSDDPDYASQLARILADSGDATDSYFWRQLAAARYEDLIALHPEAFADHAAEFWLGAGADPRRALQLARMNLAIRNTPRAHALLCRAIAADGECQTDLGLRAIANETLAAEGWHRPRRVVPER